MNSLPCCVALTAGLALLCTSASAGKPTAKAAASNPAAQPMAKKSGVPRLSGGAAKSAPVSRARKFAKKGARTEGMAPLPPKLVEQQVGKPVMEGAWARVTPGKPVDGDKAALVMVRPELVDPGYADFADHCYRGWVWALREINHVGKPNEVQKKRSETKPYICPSPGKAALWVNAPGPGIFAAECDVSTLEASYDPDHWKLRTGDGSVSTVSKLPLPNRLLFTVAAVEAGWTQVIFRGTHDRWRLFGCTVHRL